MSRLRVAFMGFRHGHILTVYRHAEKIDGLEIVAACEEDENTRRKMVGGDVKIAHDNYEKMLDEVDCDIVAVGDYFSKRGHIEIEALKRGKHVLSDKPLCTSLKELYEIERLSREKGLCVGCQLDMRDLGKQKKLRRLIFEEQIIGQIHAISFGGQHPLSYGNRTAWYFEEGKHGGTINDIAVHAVDLIPWITGRRFTTVNAARNWNACLKQVPHFKDSAQFMLTMDDGCGVLGDVSYLAPNSFGYNLPMYWRFTYWGQEGVIEVDKAHEGPMLYRNGEKEMQLIEPEPSIPGGYFLSLISEIQGKAPSLSTADVLEATRITLTIQQAADQQLTNLTL